MKDKRKAIELMLKATIGILTVSIIITIIKALN
jgi:hypothetical protein